MILRLGWNLPYWKLLLTSQGHEDVILDYYESV